MATPRCSAKLTINDRSTGGTVVFDTRDAIEAPPGAGKTTRVPLALLDEPWLAGKTVRIAFVADNPGKWLLASTVLERFDAGLWTWIEVT